MSTRKRSTEYWIQTLRPHGWDDCYEVYTADPVKQGLKELAMLREALPTVEYRLAKKSIVVTTTVVNGADT